MFTGIVETVGRVTAVDDGGASRRLSVEAGELAARLGEGDSVAVDGACLTVRGRSAAGVFDVDVMGATLERTIAGGYAVGSLVNLERALALGGRLDGHLVQGHVDGVGTLVEVVSEGDNRLMDFELPDEVAALTVLHGSIALNGVSLTVGGLPREGVCRIGVIPYTREHTNLGGLAQGARVNVEGDLIGKYVGKMLARRTG